jgi:hypothetical protein
MEQENMLEYIKNMKIIKSNKDIQPTDITSKYVGPVSWGNEIKKDIPIQQPIQTEEQKQKLVQLKNSLVFDEEFSKPIIRNIDPTDEKPYKLTKDYIVSILREHEKEEIQKRTTYEKKTINAYDLVGCIRKSYYAMKGIQEIPKTNSYPYGELVQQMGNSCHDVLQKRLPSKSNELKIKITDVYSITINVRTDILWNDNVVVEIKTKDVVPHQAEAEHIVQALIYAYLLNTHMNHQIELVQILYVARGKLDIAVFDVPITEDHMMKVGNKLQKYTSDLIAFFEADTPPPMDHKYVITKACMFCNYEHECKKFKPFTSIGG